MHGPVAQFGQSGTLLREPLRKKLHQERGKVMAGGSNPPRPVTIVEIAWRR